MSAGPERSLNELFGDDPERADALVFGRQSGPGRRGFLGGAGLAAMGAAVGAAIPFSASMPSGFVPAAMAQGAGGSSGGGSGAAPKGPQPLDFPGKSRDLVVLGDRPLVAETPEHQLDDETTHTAKCFVRNNGHLPEAAPNADGWKITVEGEVGNRLELTLGDLK